MRAVWLNLSLLATALALFVVLVVTQGAVTTSERRARSRNLLPAFRVTDVREIRIERPNDGNGPLILERDPKSPDLHAYSLKTPGPEGATWETDPAALGQLLSSLEYASFIRRLGAESSARDELSWERPKLVVDLAMGPLSYQIVVGAEATTPPDAYYVRVTESGREEAVGVVGGAVVEAWGVGPEELLGRMLFPFGMNETQELDVTSWAPGGEPHHAWSLSADEVGFRLGRGGPRAARDRVEGLFFQLARAKVEASTDAAARPTAEAPLFRVNQTTRAGQKLEVTVVGDCPSQPELWWVERTAPKPLSGCVPRSIPFDLQSPQLVSRSLAPVRYDEVDHITVTLDGARLDLIRKDAAYLLVEPEPQAVPRETGDDFLKDVLHLRGEPTEAPTGPALGVLELKAHLTRTSAVRPFRIELFSLAGEARLIARRDDDGQALLLERRARELLSPRAPWYRPRQVFDWSPDSVVALRTEAPGLTPEELIRRDEGFAFEDGADSDPVLVERFLETLAGLKVRRFVSSGEPVSQDKPSLRVTLRFSEGPPQVLSIGAAVRGGNVAWLEGGGPAFVLDPGLVRLLRVSLRARTLALPPLSQLRALRILGPSGSYEAQLSGGNASAEDPTPERTRTLIEAYQSLEVLGAVRAEPTPRGLTLEPLRIQLQLARDEAGGDKPEPETRELVFGDLVLHDSEPAQLLHVPGSQATFYVQRRSVLRLMDQL